MISEIHLVPPRPHKARLMAFLFLILAPFACGALVLALGQDYNWDLRNYHWYNAYALLNGRYGIDILPSQTPWFYNPALDVPFYLLATHAPARVAGFALGFVQGLNLVFLFMLAHATLIVPNPRHKVIICAMLATMGILGGGGIALLGATFYDNVTSLGMFLSALLVVRHWERLATHDLSRSMARMFLFALPAGLMMGLKLPSVIFCVGLCFAILFINGDFRRRFMLSFAFGLGVLAGAAITLGPWAAFLDTHFYSPLFPYFNDHFHSPLAPPTSARDIQFVPINWTDRLLFPFIFTRYPMRVGEIPWRDLALPALYVLLPLALVVRLLFGRVRERSDVFARTHAARYLLWSSIITYVAWLFMFGIYRYLVPLEMLAPLLLAITMGMLPLRVGTRALLTAVVLLAVVATIQPGNWGRRATWTAHTVEANIPPLGDTSHLMLLMAGFEPYSHLVTLFPPEVPVIRIQSNFASPDQDKGINQVIRARVEAHKAAKGRFLMLIPPWQHGLASGALRFFGLAMSPQTCQKVVDHLYDDNALDLCAVDYVK